MVLPGDISQFGSVVASVPELARSSDLSVRVLSGGPTNTSYFVGARNLSIDEFATPATVARIAARLRDVHSLAPVDGRFDPYDDIRRWIDLVEAGGTRLPTRLASLLVRVNQTERKRTPVPESELLLCHNDPYHLNFLDDGVLWLIDWEYAGMGEAMYDLAGIAYMLDDDGRDLLLESYFGSVEPETRQDLESLIPVFVCWNVAWSLVEMDGGVVGFDYLNMAEEFLDWLPNQD